MVKHASLTYVAPPPELQPPDGLDRDAIVAWAMLAWSQDYPEYLHLFLEGGVLMGADIGQLPMPGVEAPAPLLTWQVATKFDPRGAALADRHYSRRTIGSPQFMPPGETLVLVCDSALFGWWRPHPDSGLKSMNGLDGWTCTIFRNEGARLSSELVLEAEVMLARVKGQCGPDGMLTYVWDKRIRSVNPGYCFKRAGWTNRGRSADGRKTLLHKPFELAGVL